MEDYRNLKIRCVIIDGGANERRAFMTLLFRIIGPGAFACDKHKKKTVWRFTYWATDEEQAEIDEVWDLEQERLLDEEYRKLLSATE